MSNIIYLHQITSSNPTTLLGYFNTNDDGQLVILYDYKSVKQNYLFSLNDKQYNIIKDLLPADIKHNKFIGLHKIRFAVGTQQSVIDDLLSKLDSKVMFPVRMMTMPLHYNNKVNAQGEWYVNNNRQLFQRLSSGDYRLLLTEDVVCSIEELFNNSTEMITIDNVNYYVINFKSTQITELAEFTNILKINILWPSN